MKQSNVIKGTLAVVALVAALVVGVAVHMHLFMFNGFKTG